MVQRRMDIFTRPRKSIYEQKITAALLSSSESWCL